jgi:hypothetical protein
MTERIMVQPKAYGSNEVIEVVITDTAHGVKLEFCQVHTTRETRPTNEEIENIVLNYLVR